MMQHWIITKLKIHSDIKGMKHVEYYILKEIQQILESKDEEIRFTDIYRQRVLWLLDSH